MPGCKDGIWKGLPSESPPTERKFALLRAMINNKDTLLVQDVNLPENPNYRMIRTNVERLVSCQYKVDGTLQWIGWVDAWQLLRGPIQIK